ncbi:hypothetical protein [Janthinobacterium sp. CG_23.3]|uniref:hypothetical protein n=1 Tax=Janthinobacterium sp. CG_23.3 TaxID=3349634 RepID=UPI0038D4FAB2
MPTTTLAALLALLALALTAPTLLVLLRRKRRLQRLRFRARFEPASAFVGKDPRFAIARAGNWTFYGAMDHGNDIAQWRGCGLVAEMRFKDGVCTGVRVSEPAERGAIPTPGR